jgi:uncharacterized protein YwgA
MSDLPKAVAEITALGGGTLTGKTRLQKTAYLLESKGVGYGFDFAYHYYGPYSEELGTAAEDAKALGLLSTEEYVTAAGFPYAVFRTALEAPGGSDTVSRRARIVSVLNGYDSITLELAATADFLAKNGFSSDPWTETCRRKARKASPETVARAKQLLEHIHRL